MRKNGAMGIVVLFVVGALGVAMLAHHYSEGEKLKRQLRGTPIYSLAAMPENATARVVGQAFAISAQGPVLHSPITGRPCLMYIVTVEQETSNGKTTSWRQIIRESKAVTFVLTDATGKAIVIPTEAKTLLEFDRETRSGTFDPAEPVETAFLAKHGHTSKGWLFNKVLRYREAVIDTGETVSILGMGVREPDPEGTPSDGYRSAPPTRMRFTSSAKYPLVISDDPTTTRPAQAKSWMFHAELRYREAVIDIGETIAVFGSGVREPDPDGIPNGDYRAAMPLRMRFAGSAKYPLIICDDPKATQRTPKQLPPASQG